MSDVERTPEDEQPGDERPSRFPKAPPSAVPALDDAPGGHTPAETTRSSDDSLPPG